MIHLYNAYNNFIFSNPIVIKCPPIPSWEGVICDKNETVWDTRLNCTCQDGFITKKSIHFITDCRQSWQPDIEQCIGKIILYII